MMPVHDVSGASEGWPHVHLKELDFRFFHVWLHTHAPTSSSSSSPLIQVHLEKLDRFFHVWLMSVMVFHKDVIKALDGPVTAQVSMSGSNPSFLLCPAPFLLRR